MPLTRALPRERHPGLTAAALVLLVVAGLVWCSQAVRKAERRSGNDLVGYLEASRALYGGGDPYHLPDRFPYIYPLFLAAVIRPLAAIPAPVASVLWFVLQAACLWYVLRTADAHVGLGLGVGIIAVFGDVLQSEFLNGQVNLIVLALAVAGINLSDRNPRLASALLGGAIALKLTPALFLLFWAIERRYRLVFESALWASVFIASPWLIVRDRLWPMYESYVRDFILARTVSADPHAEAIFFTPYGFWSWLTGSVPGRVAMVASSLAVVSSLASWHLWRRPDVTRAKSVAWVYAAATPLLSPMSEVHHLTLLVPAASRAAIGIRTRAAMIAGLLFVVLIWIGRVQRTGPWYFLSILALIAATGLALGRTRQASA